MTLRLYKYRPFTTETDRDRLRRVLTHREIFCQTSRELNDPYDCNIGTADHLMHHLVRFAVFCTSGENHNDILLFSHYADKHTGLCLVFEVDNSRPIGETTFLGFSEPITYVEDFPRFDASNIHLLPKTKYAGWKYEDEYRVLADLEYNPSQYRNFESYELIEVRFGLKMKEEGQREIQERAAASGLDQLRFTKACLGRDKFKLNYCPVLSR